ncbi:MAG: DUF2079 domain-containing protein, partial [Caldilinea sp.]
LGQIDQAIWNSSRGRWLAQTDNGFEATRLTDHVEPILVLISPIYWVWEDVRALLLLQVVAAAAGGLWLYALTLRQCEKLLAAHERRQIWRWEPVQQLAKALALACALAYLLAPQLQSALLTEFHAAPLAAPLILWAFWAVDARRWRQFLAAALLVAAVKEEMALLSAGLGGWALWRVWWDGRGKPLERSALGFAATAVVAGLLWFWVATFVIVPAHAATVYGVAESTYFQRYGVLGDSPADILKGLVTRPQQVAAILSEAPRMAYLVGLLVIFGWLPLLGIDLLLLALPLLLANALSAYPAQYYGEFHYSAPLVAYAGAAAAYGVGRLWRLLARGLQQASPAFQHLPARGAATMAAVALLQNARTALLPLLTAGLAVWIGSWSVGTYLQQGRGPGAARHDPPLVTAHHRLLPRFTEQIPAEAPVTATAGVHPHVSHRRYVYQFPLGVEAPVPATWALLDVTTNTDMAPGDLKAQVDALLAGDWGVVDAADGFLLLARGVGRKTIGEPFYTFVRGPAAAPAEPLQLAAIAADDWPRWRQSKLVVEWEVGEGYDPKRDTPWLEIAALDGEEVATLESAAPPALVWASPERWQPGEKMRVTTLPLSLPRTAVVRAAGASQQPAAILRRFPDGHLAFLPETLATAADLGAALAAAGLGPLHSARGQARLPDGSAVALQAWVAQRAPWPGERLDLWIQWGAGQWPAQLTAFVHLRHNSVTVAQADGLPRLWPPAAGWHNDWRQLAVPPDSPLTGEWTVALGLYDAQNGQRVPINGDRTELVVTVPSLVAAPFPDQACALIPATCGGR